MSYNLNQKKWLKKTDNSHYRMLYHRALLFLSALELLHFENMNLPEI